MRIDRLGTARRRSAHRRGVGSEWLALIALMLKGYLPLARRFSGGGGEIDLVVRRGRTIAFVEVKARGSIDEAAQTIDRRKRLRFSRAARSWVARHPQPVDVTLRIDAVFVGRRAWPAHVENLFEIENP